MAGELTRDFVTYTSDDGNAYSVKLGEDVAAITELGFGAFDVANPSLPRGYRMRHVDVINAASGRRRVYPVGSLACDVWTATDKLISVADKGNATPVVWAAICLIGERRTIPHAIHA